MIHIRQINSVGTNSYTLVDVSGYNGLLEEHPSVVLYPDLFEVSDSEIPEFHQLVKPNLVIESVTKLQLKLALIDFGIMPSSILIAINQIESVTTRETFLTLWSDAVFFERNDPSLISMSSTLGLTSEQVDALFRLASTK